MPENRCHIRLMGDVMIGRLVNETITQKGYKYPWGNVLPYLNNPGINIINLEAALTNSEDKLFKMFNFKADPDKVTTLTEANIHIVNIANNHILDYSFEGMKETIRALNQSGILHTGAGDTIEEARKPAIIECNNIKIGILGFTDNEPNWKANSHPGINYIKIGDLEQLKNGILDLRSKVDILILSAHLGPNMVEMPSPKKIDFAHQLIDLGVDIIHGHSAHLFQGVEVYNNKVILHDTGDFIDDYQIDPLLKNNKSFLFEIEIVEKTIQKLKLIPVIIKDMQVNFATKEEAQWCVARMQFLSEKFNTEITNEGEIIIK